MCAIAFTEYQYLFLNIDLFAKPDSYFVTQFGSAKLNILELISFGNRLFIVM